MNIFEQNIRNQSLKENSEQNLTVIVNETLSKTSDKMLVFCSLGSSFSVQLTKRMAVMIPRPPPGPPGFGYTQHVVQIVEGDRWKSILYCDSYMEAHRAMPRFEKSNICDQIKEIYRASHVSGHIPAMPTLLQPAMAHACAKRFRSMICSRLCSVIFSNMLFKVF